MVIQNFAEEIIEKEKERGIRREVVEEPLIALYRKKYCAYMAQMTEKKLYIPKLKLKLVYEQPIIKATEIIRYLAEKELDTLNIKKLRYRTEFKTASQLYFPYLFSTGKFQGHFIKADIKACFYSIYSLFGIDANIIADINLTQKEININAVGKGILDKKNSQLIKDLETLKQYRNILYGLTRASWYLKLHGEKREKLYFRGRLQNLDLTVLICAILHDIVTRFKEDIIYWNIDGGIIKAEIFNDMRQYVYDAYGLTLKKEVEAESVNILGLGSYSVGEYETEHFRHGVCSYYDYKEYLFKVHNSEIIKKIVRRCRDA